MRCGQDGCDNPATHRYTWPGKDEAGVCSEHIERLRDVAASLRFHLQLIPVTDDTEHASCSCCDGCGQIADSDDGEPWSQWESLPAGADMAVRLGIVSPIPCPECAS